MTAGGIDAAIVNARSFLPDGSEVAGAILIDDGRIVGLVDDTKRIGAAKVVYDAGGRPVLPGLIDSHFHVGFHSAETDFETETRSAAIGGVTTVCRFFRHLHSYDESLPAEIELGRRAAYVDFAFHVGILTEDHLAKLDTWVNVFGVRSFKMYTCYKGDEGRAIGIRGETDGFIFDALRAIARMGNVVQIVHCENEEIIDRQLAAMRLQPVVGGDLNAWSEAMPPMAEVEAITRVAYLADQAGAEFLVPHVSSADALETIRRLKAGGQKIYAETCPHYLALDTNAASGILAKVNPPIRPAGHAAALWEGVRDGTVDVIGSDHATTMRSQKIPGDPWRSAPGFAGVATILPALHDSGVLAGEITLGDIARVQARAAKIMRLRGKGRIEVGADADLVVLDPDRKRVVSAADLGSASDFSVFENASMQGWPAMTFVRGDLVAREGEVLGRQGHGRYLAR
jgi:dihydropyrimidinase